MRMRRTVSPPLPADSFVLSQDPGKSPAHFSRLFVGAYERDQGPERLLPTEEVKNCAFHGVETVARPTLEQAATTGRLSEHASHGESAALSGRPALGPSLRPQSELSLWPGRTDETTDPGVAMFAADCWRRSKLECIASVPRSSWMFDEEESQERNGEATRASVKQEMANRA